LETMARPALSVTVPIQWALGWQFGLNRPGLMGNRVLQVSEGPREAPAVPAGFSSRGSTG